MPRRRWDIKASFQDDMSVDGNIVVIGMHVDGTKRVDFDTWST